VGPDGPASVSYFDTNVPAGKPIPKEILNSFQRGLLGSFGKTTSSVEEMPWNGRDIRKIVFTGELYGQPIFGVFFIITNGPRIYVLGLVGDHKEYVEGPAGINMLNSFTIVPKP
jgi:hypothetical protein